MIMKKAISKTIYALGFFALFFGIYLGSFYLISNKIIRPYEKANNFESHAIRPLYNVFYYPMRYFSANGSSFKKDVPDVYFGIVEKEPSNDSDDPYHRNADIDQIDNGLVMIGFTGNKSTIRAFDRIENGQYLRLDFGRALTKDHDRFINRLISFEVIDLMDDPRVELKEYSDTERRMIEQEYTKLLKLNDVRKKCVQKYISEYKERALNHCIQAGYARNIGGGCFHLVPYFANTTVIEQALKLCPVETE